MKDQEKIQNVFSVFEPSEEKIQEVLNMTKLSDLTQSLGLTKTQIGLYIKENLVHPTKDALKHYEAGVLTKLEVKQLEAVQCLRVHEFGLEEIKYLTICRNAWKDYLQHKSEKKLTLYSNMDDVLSAIAVLQANAPEGKELEKLQREIRRFDHLPKDPNYKPSFWEKNLPIIVLTAILGILLITLFAKLNSLASRILAILIFFAIGAMIALGAGLVYLVKQKPPKAYSIKGMAKIEKVNIVTEFDTTFALGKTVVPGAGFREQGNGGIWQFVFMFWNEIRPDHYFPVVRFSHNGKERIATFRFGGFKHTWESGASIPVYWSKADDGIVYPENTSFMVKKSVCALCIAFLLGGIFCYTIGPVTKAANTMFYVGDIQEILFGMEEDTYEGTELITDSEILLDFSYFTGSKKLALNCKKGDCIYLETIDYDESPETHFMTELNPGYGFMIADQINYDQVPLSKFVYSIDIDGTYYVNVEAYKATGRVHAVVSQGKDIAQKAGTALNALAETPSMAIKSTVTEKKEEPIEMTAALFCDNGRYYQKTEVKTGDNIQIQEILFDGTTGWSRTQTSDAEQAMWTQTTGIPAEPDLRGFLKTNGAKLIDQSECFEDISCLDGSFICYMTDEYLKALSDETEFLEYKLSHVYILFDEITQKATFFKLISDYNEAQGDKTVSVSKTTSVEVMENADPAAEIQKHLAELP